MSWPPETDRLWPPDDDPESDFKLPRGARHVRTRKDPELGTVVTYETPRRDARVLQLAIMLIVVGAGFAIVLAFCAGCGGAPFSAELADPQNEVAPDAAGESGGADSGDSGVGGGWEDAALDAAGQADATGPDSGQPSPELDAGPAETSPPETAPEPAPEAGPVCTPISQGGIRCNNLAYPTPSYFCMNGQGSITPPECMCAETYNCDCLRAHVHPCAQFYCEPSSDGVSVTCQ